MTNVAEHTSLQTLGRLLAGALSPRDVPSADWSGLAAEAEVHNLSAYLLYAIEQGQTPIPAELHEQLRQVNRLAVTRFMMLHKAQQSVSEAFEAANIPHIWLKGIVLAETVYPDPAHRPMVDLDVLVKPEHVPAALGSLHDLGYHTDTPQSLFDPAKRIREGSIHHHVLRGGPARSIVIELHFNLLVPRSREFLSPEPEQWFHSQAVAYTFAHERFISLSNEAHLLYLCAHMVLHHGLQDFALVRSLDVHRMVTLCTLDWQKIVEKAIDLRWTYVVERALLQAQALFPTPVPPDILEELRAHQTSDEERRKVDALANPGAFFEGVRQSINHLDRRARAQWIWRVAVPGPSYMRWRYAVPENQLVWPYYLRRWLHQLREVSIWVRTQIRMRRSA